VDTETKGTVAAVVQGAAGTEVAKQLYADGLQPSVQSAGSLLSLVPRAVNSVFLNLHKWITDKEYQLECYKIEKEYNIASVRQLLEQKLETVPPEHIVAPAPYVAVPALQQISYCMDNEELREMYANLLAASMDERVKNGIHPSYVNIIAQLSPDEAKILRWFADNDKPMPIVRSRKTGLNTMIYSHIGKEAKCECLANITQYIVNLDRLGLLVVRYNSRDYIGEYRDIYKQIETVNEIEFCEYGYCFVSKIGFGKAFIKTCILPPNEITL
jgi:hypothetical protein